MNSRFFVPDQKGWQGVDPSNVLYIKGGGSYSHVRTQGGEITVSKTLSFFNGMLKQYPALLRVHKSYIVNVESIARINRGAIWTLVLTNDTEVPVSLSYRDVVAKAMQLSTSV